MCYIILLIILRFNTMWQSYLKGFKAYLQLEKSLSKNSVEAYIRDVEKLIEFLITNGIQKNPSSITLK